MILDIALAVTHVAKSPGPVDLEQALDDVARRARQAGNVIVANGAAYNTLIYLDWRFTRAEGNSANYFK